MVLFPVDPLYILSEGYEIISNFSSVSYKLQENYENVGDRI